MNLTLGQKIAMALVLLNVLGGATAQLTPMLGSTIATDIATIASLFATVISGWMFIVTGQGSLVKQVADMPGVERVAVNAQANSTLAAVATDPAQRKVGPADPNLRTTLQDIAKGN